MDYKHDFSKEEDDTGLTPERIAVGGVAYTVILSLRTAFGNFTDFPKNSFYFCPEEIGILIIIEFMILPLFFKKLRKKFWSKKGIIIMLGGILVSIPLVVRCLINRGML